MLKWIVHQKMKHFLLKRIKPLDSYGFVLLSLYGLDQASVGYLDFQVSLQIFFLFCLQTLYKVLWVWNYIKIIKWQKFHFWVNYPFNNNNKKNI